MTSTEAYQKSATIRVTQAQLILRVLKQAHGSGGPTYLSGQRIADRTTLTYVQVMRHMAKLKRAGQIQASVYTVINRSGFKAEQFRWLSDKPVAPTPRVPNRAERIELAARDLVSVQTQPVVGLRMNALRRALES